MRFTKVLSIAALLAFGLAGCAPAPASPEPGPSPLVPVEWASIESSISLDGSVSLQTAVNAFGLAFGALPGSTAPEPSSSLFSGTSALRMLTEHWSELIEEQRTAAVEAVPELADAPGSLTVRPAVVRTAPLPVDGDYAAEVKTLFAFYLSKVGATDPGWMPSVRLGTSQKKKTADAYSVLTPGRCRIVLQPSFFATQDPAARHFILAHEVFHCVQGVVTNGAPVWRDWIVEGGATWAALGAPTIAGSVPESLLRPLWDVYLGTPERSLYTESYQAFAFFVYLQNRGVDVWAALGTLPAANDDALLALTHGGSELTDWASGFFRDAAAGEPWDLRGPGITATRPDSAEATITVNAGDTAVVKAPPGGAAIVPVQTNSDILQITAPGIGHVRLSDDTVVDTPVSATYCLRDDGCACPDRAAPTGMISLPPGEFDVAVTGGTAPVTATIRGLDVDCSGPWGAWDLTTFEMTVPGTLRNLLTVSGEPLRLDLSSDGTAPVTATSAAYHQVATAGSVSQEHDAVYDGRVDGRITLDTAAGTGTFVEFVGSMNVTVDGRNLGTPDAGLFAEPATSFHYTVDGDTMLWTLDGPSTVMWTWTRPPAN